jgi:acyl-CoA synthetase (AMP-forming)/AMP-acid ligase II/pimeloyl-ACP methyl ester carboxylesterase
VSNTAFLNSDLIRNKPLPYESHALEIDGYYMHYLDECTGDRDRLPVVILLHGNPTWCYYYRRLIERLKAKFRVIVPDYIGCGLSSNPVKKQLRAGDRIKHLQELTAELGLKRYSLVMHDWGGSLGTALAQSNIPAIDRLVYLNTTLTETESLPKIIKAAAKPFIGKFLTKYTKRFLKFTTEWGVCKKLTKEIKRGYLYPYHSTARRSSIWDFVDDIPFDSSHPSYSLMLDLAKNMPTLSDIPVQIVWGLKDPCFHREMLNKVAHHFPQARVLEIPQASHLVLEDAPELAGKTISEFLEQDRDQLLAEARNISNRKISRASDGENALYAGFLRMVEKSPLSNAVIAPSFFADNVSYTHLNYDSLFQLVNKYQRGMSELGLRSGDKVIMLVPAGIEFLALSFAVMGRGAIPVFIDPGMGLTNLLACIEDISPQAFIGSFKAQYLRLRYKKLFAGLKFHIMAHEWLFFGGPNLSFLKKFSSRSMESVGSSGISLIAFTSGATGKPKGVIYTDEMVAEQLRIFSEIFELKEGSKDLPLLPIFSLFNLANGICSVFPPVDASNPLSLEPEKLIRIIYDLDVQYSFGSPTLWNKIAEYCVRSGSKLTPLRKILMAGAPVGKEVIEKVMSFLDNGEIYTPYGATEALPVTFVSSKDILNNVDKPSKTGEQGTFVGKPVPGLEARIIEASDSPLASIDNAKILGNFEIGEIIIKGKNVSSQYWDLPDATMRSKIKDKTGVWHRMGDMGYLDENGNIYFCGRKAHVVSIDKKVYYSIPLERIFNQHQKVKRSALVSLYDGKEAGIVIEPQPEFWPESQPEREQFRLELLALAANHPLSKDITKIFFHRSFPVDARHNAKIFRDKLGKWASVEGYTLEKAA